MDGWPVEELHPGGDQVGFKLGEEHWHGAAPDHVIVHIAMQDTDETDRPVMRGAHVTEDEYHW